MTPLTETKAVTIAYPVCESGKVVRRGRQRGEQQ